VWLWGTGSFKVLRPSFLETSWRCWHLRQQGTALYLNAKCLSKGVCRRLEMFKVQGSLWCPPWRAVLDSKLYIQLYRIFEASNTALVTQYLHVWEELHGDWNGLKETITESKAKQEQFVLGRTNDIPVRMVYDQTVIKNVACLSDVPHLWVASRYSINMMYYSKNKDPSLETRLQECGICWRPTWMFIRINALKVKVNISGWKIELCLWNMSITFTKYCG